MKQVFLKQISFEIHFLALKYFFNCYDGMVKKIFKREIIMGTRKSRLAEIPSLYHDGLDH